MKRCFASSRRLRESKVRYDVFDSSDAVEAKLLAGATGYDIMTVSNPYLAAKFRLRSTKSSIALDYQIGETQIGRSSIW
jgi:spermidine/putrescine-binding protein